ncbi:MAG: phosphoadenylyl-sulfate reductase [Pararhodobacter sp.]|nr:phosphoadenylyl-sulfate reductase [Pararhodobacter sp.]
MPRDLAQPADLDGLNARFAGNPQGALRFALSGALGRVALVSSFGAESAVLLHMAAQIDRQVPVLFIDTLMLFPETLDYHQALAGLLGLGNIQRLTPDRVALFQQDPDASLHRANPDSCCHLRKTLVLERALAGFDGWVSGRKRYQTSQRAELALFEREEASERIKINPLAGFDAPALADYFERHALPRHSLVARGYPSIGCAPCTGPAAPGEHPRAGRWRGKGKEECGIHIVDGRVVRQGGA